VVNATPRPLYPRERPGLQCIGGWVGPRAGLDGCGNFRPPTGIRSTDRPARSKSLYGLRYTRVKVKWSRYRPGVAQRVSRGIALLFHDRGSRKGVSGQQHAPAALYPRERPGTHFRGSWVGRSGRAENLVPTGIRSRTAQPGSSVAIPTKQPGPQYIRVHK